MTRSNKIPNLPGRYTSFDFEAFDLYPLYLKKFLWTAPLNATIGSGLEFEPEPMIRANIIKSYSVLLPRLTEVTWGPDHPQASTPYKPLRL